MEENSETSFFQVKQYKPMATGFEIWCMFLSILLLGKKNKDGKTRHRGIDVASRFAPLPRKKAMASVEKLF